MELVGSDASPVGGDRVCMTAAKAPAVGQQVSLRAGPSWLWQAQQLTSPRVRVLSTLSSLLLGWCLICPLHLRRSYVVDGR